ncbi:ENPP5 [Mytilus edulis]|uniref:ENPP5 n=1 Tax=Mytilus edulis TaxID=6550 RepID=A0A8S3TP43_MYTED|nr:ENPP5 [Mytilus edulis]
MAALFIFDIVNRRALRRDRVFRDRTDDLDFLNDDQLIARYRFPRQSILDLTDTLRDAIERPSNRSKAIPPHIQVYMKKAMALLGIKCMIQYSTARLTCKITKPDGGMVENHYGPNIWKHYNKSVPFKNRIDTVITWLTDEHIDLVNLYFHEPDATGHAFGPDSPQIIEKVKAMDKILGYLLDKFDSHNLTNKVNLILTSDHGMTTIDTVNKVVDITDNVNMSKIQFTVDNGPIMQIQPSLGLIDDVVQSFQNLFLHISVFKKEEIPDHWHYRNNRRIMPVFLLAEEGWSITTVSETNFVL